MKSLKQKLTDVTRELKALAKETEKLTRAIEKLEKGPGSKKAKPKVVKAKTAQKTASKKASGAVRSNAMKVIKAQRKKGLSFEKIARYLESRKIPTFSGKGKWRGQTVHKLYKKN